MSYQEFSEFPFIDFGVLLMMIAVAVQILRGKFTLTGGLLEVIKTNKSAFDEATDPLVVYLARMARQSPDEAQRTLEWLYVLATGEPLNSQARAKLAEATAQKQLKDIDLRPNASLVRQFEMMTPPLPSLNKADFPPYATRLPEEDPSLPEEPNTAG